MPEYQPPRYQSVEGWNWQSISQWQELAHWLNINYGIPTK